MGRLADHPRHDRPRERLERLGAAALSDTELVALVLRSGRQGASALELAAALLAANGDAATLAARDPHELVAIAGMGPAKAASLLAAFELGARRVFRPGERVAGTHDVARIAQHELRLARREQVLVMVLAPGHRLVRCVALSSGSATGAPLPVREVLHAVLREDGVAFAVAHNHPSGDPTPSEEDRRVTLRLADGARAVGIRLLDHVIVAGDSWARVPLD